MCLELRSWRVQANFETSNKGWRLSIYKSIEYRFQQTILYLGFIQFYTHRNKLFLKLSSCRGASIHSVWSIHDKQLHGERGHPLTKYRQHIKKQRCYFADKGLYSQRYGFSVVMYGCEKWTIKTSVHRRIDDFELWCWRRLSRVPSTARRSNQSILKEINPEYSLEELKMNLQYFGHLMWRADSLEKTLMLGKIDSIRDFSNEWALCLRWTQYWSLSFSISPSSEYSGLISFRIDWFWSPCSPRDSQEPPALLFKSISSLALNLLYGPILTSLRDYWKNHSFDYMDLCWQSDVSAFKYSV